MMAPFLSSLRRDDGASINRNSRVVQAPKKEPKIKSVSAWELLQENRRRAASLPMLMRPPQRRPEGSSASSSSSSGHLLVHPPQDRAEHLAWMRLPPGLHEVAGEAGSGKSQIAMSLSVDVATALFGRHPSPVYYVSTRSIAKFVERLHQMVHARGACPSVLQRILIREVSNVENLLELLDGLLQANFVVVDENSSNNNCQRKRKDHHASSVSPPPPPRLVVLDSVADLIRGEAAPAPGEGWTTYATLRRVARLLRAFAERHDVAVLCVNQVTTNVGTGTLKPALGLTWAQEMDRSYMVSRTVPSGHPDPATASALTTSEGADATGTANQLRSMELRRSSQFGPHKTQFTVQACGVSMCTGSF